jgi:hypothetical protein
MARAALGAKCTTLVVAELDEQSFVAKLLDDRADLPRCKPRRVSIRGRVFGVGVGFLKSRRRTSDSLSIERWRGDGWPSTPRSAASFRGEAKRIRALSVARSSNIPRLRQKHLEKITVLKPRVHHRCCGTAPHALVVACCRFLPSARSDDKGVRTHR